MANCHGCVFKWLRCVLSIVICGFPFFIDYSSFRAIPQIQASTAQPETVEEFLSHLTIIVGLSSGSTDVHARGCNLALHFGAGRMWNLDLFDNWLSFVPPYLHRHILVLCTDDEAVDHVRKHSLSYKLDQEKSGWKYRSRAVRDTLAQGQNVLVADVDAIWLRDPIPYLAACAGDVVTVRDVDGWHKLNAGFALYRPGFFLSADMILRHWWRFGSDDQRGLRKIFEDASIGNTTWKEQEDGSSVGVAALHANYPKIQMLTAFILPSNRFTRDHHLLCSVCSNNTVIHELPHKPLCVDEQVIVVHNKGEVYRSKNSVPHLKLWRLPMPRLAVVFIFFGSSWTAAHRASLESLATSSETADVHLFSDIAPPCEQSNLIYHTFTFADLVERVRNRSGANLTGPVYKAVCSIKPLIGVLFADILRGYAYWAYGDLDVLFGRLSLFPWESTCDIMTPEKEKISGPFTIVRNAHTTNHLYMDMLDWKNALSSHQYFNIDEDGCDACRVKGFTEIAHRAVVLRNLHVCHLPWLYLTWPRWKGIDSGVSIISRSGGHLVETNGGVLYEGAVCHKCQRHSLALGNFDAMAWSNAFSWGESFKMTVYLHNMDPFYATIVHESNSCTHRALRNLVNSWHAMRTLIPLKILHTIDINGVSIDSHPNLHFVKVSSFAMPAWTAKFQLWNKSVVGNGAAAYIELGHVFKSNTDDVFTRCVNSTLCAAGRDIIDSTAMVLHSNGAERWYSTFLHDMYTYLARAQPEGINEPLFWRKIRADQWQRLDFDTVEFVHGCRT